MNFEIDLPLSEAIITEGLKHTETKQEKIYKRDICQLLIKNNHSKYARRFWALYLNLVDSKKMPDFVAAISFDDNTVFLSDAFFQGHGKGDETIFNQLDMILRHELAHNLMMHQIRLMHVFKQSFAKSDPEEAYEQIKYSSSMHELLNWIEDFEISNKRYSDADKAIARKIKLNGREINGLVTEDHREKWLDMSLETMYNQLHNELIKINSEIRNNPNWRPTRINKKGEEETDGLSYQGASMIHDYLDTESYSVLSQYGISLLDIEKESGTFKKLPDVMKRVLKTVYGVFKTYKTDNRQADIKKVLSDIAATAPEDEVHVIHPDTGEIVVTLYSADFKALVSNLLKKIIEEPIKLPQAFVDAWTKVMQVVGPMDLSNEELDDIISGIGPISVDVLM